MKKRTKIIILSAMIVLLGVTGYLNIMLNNSVKQANTNVASTSYFSSYRTNRESTRDQELMYYDAIIESEASTETAVKAAEDAKLSLIKTMEKELAVENLIIAQGFSDCVISIGDSKVSVIVKGTSLTESEVAQICNIVIEQLGVTYRNILVYSAE